MISLAKHAYADFHRVMKTGSRHFVTHEYAARFIESRVRGESVKVNSSTEKLL